MRRPGARPSGLARPDGVVLESASASNRKKENLAVMHPVQGEVFLGGTNELAVFGSV